MTARLIACVLGGTAAGAKTGLHDVTFVVGTSLETVHGQLLDGWFGDPHGMHVDAWCFIDNVQGYRVQLSQSPAESGLHFFFINIGGYRPGVFALAILPTQSGSARKQRGQPRNDQANLLRFDANQVAICRPYPLARVERPWTILRGTAASRSAVK